MSRETPRIGREMTPAEHSLANALERPEAAEYHGSALCWSRTGKDWEDVPAEERERWIAEALRMLTEHARSNGPDRGPDGDGGLPLPTAEVA